MASTKPANPMISELRAAMEEPYRRRTPGSLALHQQATVQAQGQRERPKYGPYPLYMEYGKGASLFDADGNQYTDFGNSMTALIHGHANEQIQRAVAEAMSKGSAPGPFPTRYRDRLAQMVCERMPGVEKVIFSLSGTESDMYAIRIARAYTGRPKVLRFRGAYHGTYDDVIGVEIPYPGIPENTGENVVFARFNDREETERAIAEHRDELAAVIVEPIMGSAGYIQQRDGFLQWLREATLRHGVLLIFDEVITGFRWSTGGALEYYQITPPADIVAMGKNVGGGIPSGVVGGRAEIMEVMVPAAEKLEVPAGGTFAGNPVSCAAGVACLEQLTPEVYERLNRLGRNLREGFRATFAELGINGQVTGDASTCCIHMNPQDVRDGETAAQDEKELNELVRLGLINRGVIWSSGGFSISTPMTQEEVDRAVDALRGTLLEMKPVLERAAPHMLL